VRAPLAIGFIFPLALLAAAARPALAQEIPVPGQTPTQSAPAQTATPAKPLVKNGIVGLDAMTSTVFQEGQSSFSGLSFRMRIHSAAVVQNLEILPTFEYWQNTSTLSSFDIKTQRRDATLGADVRWVFNHKTWRPYAGFGLALHFLNNELRRPNLGVRNTEALIKGGVNALGGVNFGMTDRLGSFVELKFLGVSKYRQIKFNTGLSWNL
jgi:hypothetical protein